jgi:hypothetical protein
MSNWYARQQDSNVPNLFPRRVKPPPVAKTPVVKTPAKPRAPKKVDFESSGSDSDRSVASAHKRKKRIQYADPNFRRATQFTTTAYGKFGNGRRVVARGQTTPLHDNQTRMLNQNETAVPHDPSMHAEIQILKYAKGIGLGPPRFIKASNKVCPSCVKQIETSGGKVHPNTPHTARWGKNAREKWDRFQAQAHPGKKNQPAGPLAGRAARTRGRQDKSKGKGKQESESDWVSDDAHSTTSQSTSGTSTPTSSGYNSSNPSGSDREGPPPPYGGGGPGGSGSSVQLPSSTVFAH